jgi:RNA polymerase sigma factor (sigma-70 family)
MASLKGSGVPSPHGGDSDEELLFYMAMREEDGALARTAWDEFYTRHVNYLYGACRKAFGCMGEEVVADVVQQSFVRVYENAGSFDGHGKTGEDARWRTRAWLGTIANRVFLDTVRKQPVLVPALNDPDGSEADIISRGGKWWTCDDKVEDSPRIRLLEQGLTKLNEKEREVLCVTAFWYRPGAAQQRIPPADLQRLAASLQTTGENVRQIRKRALSKLRDFIESQEDQN